MADKGLKVSRASVVSLFQALDYKTADKWNDKRLAEKLQGLPKMVDDDVEVEDEKLAKLLKDLLKAMSKGAPIELTVEAAAKDEDEDEEDEKPAKKAKKEEKKPAKASKKDEDEDEEEESEDEDSDEDEESEDEDLDDEEEEEEKPKKKAKEAKPAKKPAKKAKDEDDEDEEDDEDSEPVKKKPAKKAEKKGPGVIQTIIAALRGASEDKPISKERILKKLVKAFPDRDEKAMKSTISSQIPSGLKTEKGLEVEGDKESGYWLPSEDE